MKDDVRTVKDVVEEILSEDRRARNDDKWLIIKVLQRMGYNIHIDKRELEDMPSFESIRRTRQKFQEEGKYPADEEIKEGREKEKEKMDDIHGWWPDSVAGDTGLDEEPEQSHARYEEEPEKSEKRSGDSLDDFM